MADASLQGRILWYELLTRNMDAAKRFYTAVVGWTTAPFEQSPDPYELWMRAGDIPVGGVMTIPPGMPWPPCWGLYVGVASLEAGAGQFETLGGKTLSEVIAVPSVGRMRVMQDPQGAAISIYEPESPPPLPEARPEIGDVSWHELYTTDAAAAIRFYGTMFGWKERTAMDMGPMGQYHIFERKWDLGGMMNKPAELASVPPFWGLYFRIPDIQEGAERVRANGGRITNGPMEVPDGSWIVNCMDPEGAAFSLHQSAGG